MAEAEDVLTDVAREATVFTQRLWRRHRPPPTGPRTWTLSDAAERIDLLLTAAFGQTWSIRRAQPPARANLLMRVLGRSAPDSGAAVPATDGRLLWLPGDLGLTDKEEAAARYRLLALQQAMRALRGSAVTWARAASVLEKDLVLVLEADAADADLCRALPGMAGPLQHARKQALLARPPLSRFAPGARMLECALRERLARPSGSETPTSGDDTLHVARAWARRLADAAPSVRSALCKDLWTGELRAPPSEPATVRTGSDGAATADQAAPRSARLARTPRARIAPDDEDDEQPGLWMVQADQPHEMAENPLGLQRPTDRDVDTAAEDFAEDVAELSDTRLVSTPGRASEVLLSDDPPPLASAPAPADATATAGHAFDYPEWDYRASHYRHPGARVHERPVATGDTAWVTATLERHRMLLAAVRRGFEMLTSDRVQLRRQLDGDDIDLEAAIEARADFAAGLPMAQALYRTSRPLRRSLAITLLVDVSGSTDSWVADERRVIDVEREALLLVCLALDSLREPYCVQAFSGQGVQGVTVRALKRFDESYGSEVALRIAALEPEHYTRAGAALRHSSAGLMRQPARHRLLIMLSDGKPNDIDEYDGRYGIEDMRQAVVEARLQGVSPFCLTVDRQAAGYLARVFGKHHYTLVQQPDRLPDALLGWLRHLIRR